MAARGGAIVQTGGTVEHGKTLPNGPRSPGEPSHSLETALVAALEQGRTAEARETLSKILARPQLESDLLLRVGIAFAERELYAEASQAFARCAKDYPQVFESHYNLALAQLALGKYAEALAAIKRAPEGSAQLAIAKSYLRGKIEGAMGLSREAERDLSIALKGAPQEENYALDLGLFYLRERNYQKATEVLERSAATNPGSPFLWLGLSLAQYLGGRPAESVETSKKALRIDPNLSSARVLIAFALYMEGKFNEAEKTAAAGLDAILPSPYLYFLHAAALLKLQSKDHKRMLTDLTRAAQAIPDCALCYLARSKVHQQMGNLQQARSDLEKAVALDAKFSEAWYRLASVYAQTGQLEEAQRARRRFQELKEEKSSREAEMIREVFMKTLEGTKTPGGAR